MTERQTKCPCCGESNPQSWVGLTRNCGSCGHSGTTSLIMEQNAEIERLRAPFRNADNEDWQRLFDELLCDSGHGRFWKAVMAEMRGVLTSDKGDS